MADQKLSELSAASGLTGDELAYLVQGGASVRSTTGALRRPDLVIQSRP